VIRIVLWTGDTGNLTLLDARRLVDDVEDARGSLGDRLALQTHAFRYQVSVPFWGHFRRHYCSSSWGDLTIRIDQMKFPSSERDSYSPSITGYVFCSWVLCIYPEHCYFFMAVYKQLPTSSYVMSVLLPLLHTLSFPYTSRFHKQCSTTLILSRTAMFAAYSDTAPHELSCSLVSVRNQPTSLFCTIQFARDDHTIRAWGRALGESSRLLDENGVDLQAVGFLLTGGRNADYVWHVAVVFRVRSLHSVSR
jgi:hypothetical protein